MEDKILEERKEKFLGAIKKPQFWVLLFLGIAVILGVFIRSLPMQDHGGGRPGLWDIARDDWTLGPDLDPWLFLRTAKSIVVDGAAPKVDMLRNVPLGFETAKETLLLPQMIAWTHSFVNLFGVFSVEFAGVIFPVIMFGLTIVVFFLFVREVFLPRGRDEKDTIRPNLIAMISTFIMVVVPAFLPRTVAGIPEKESAIFFFMFLAFYLFLKAWYSKSNKSVLLLGLAAGVVTGMGGLISGLSIYIFVVVALASLISFILGTCDDKKLSAYAVWLVSSFGVLLFFSQRFTLVGLTTSTTTGISAFVLFIMLVDMLVWRTNISKWKMVKKINLPKNLVSILYSVVLAIVLVSVLFGPEFIIAKLKSLHQELFKAVTGRWNSTVAENRQPYFVEWVGSFGPYIQNIPVMFWMFVVGSIVAFKKLFRGIKDEDSWKLTGFYVLFLFALIFSRYSSSSMFNGENFVSKAVYYIAVILLVYIVVKTYFRYRKEGHKGFETLNYSSILLIVLFVITVFSARSAIRLVMVLGPIGAIFVGFLIVEMMYRYRESKDSTAKTVYGALAIIAVLLGAFMFINFNDQIQAQAFGFVPSSYNQQWQKAMDWVRTNTDESAVFGHWWDYGYWVQSIGERATMTDGGNAIPYWNYLSGRHVLTGDNQADALEFLYNHNVDYFLIDSTDIGKYGAFSSIGSDKDFDRFSFIPVAGSDQSQTRETADGLQRVYPIQAGIDEDIVYDSNGSKIFLPSGKAAIIGIISTIVQNGSQIEFRQPIAVFFDGRTQHRIPLRYLEHRGNFFDFGSGLNGTAKVLQGFSQSQQGLVGDEMGGVIYISPRVMRGFLAQKYLLDDPFNEFGQFEVAHRESSLIVDSIRSAGANTSEFLLFQGRLQGPITIWSVNYLGDEEIRVEYQDRDATKYLDWEL